MFRFSVESQNGWTLLKVAGKLSGPMITDLQGWAWDAIERAAGQQVIVDLDDVTFIGPEGKDLLLQLQSRGALLQGHRPMTQAIVQEVRQKVARSLRAGSQ
jgi:anti-anti-sigma regulatory factor